MERVAGRWPTVRRAMARVGAELSRAAGTGTAPADPAAGADSTLYGGSYFGLGRDSSGDREGRSGYASYDRISSNADIAAYCVWRHFSVRTVLDVGCARGYLVEALRDLGLDAEGSDVSAYAVEHAAPGAIGRVRQGNLTEGLPYGDAAFDLVTCLETLEHLEPHAVAGALAELRRVCGGVLVASIPSFGPNPSGPDGHLDGKVRPERLDHYRSLGDRYAGPVPFADLAVDADGVPIEGHLTIASYGWWTERFAEAGFERLVDVERRIYADISPVELDQHWNLYVLAIPGTPASVATAKSPGRTLPELGLLHPLYEHAASMAAAASAPPPAPGVTTGR
jgi:SAM-dependent methyltransferase